MKIEANITKTKLFFLIASLFVITGAIFAFAYNSSPANPAVFGHSINEIDGFPNCTSQQALTHNSSGWSCISTQPPVDNGYSSAWTSVQAGGDFTFEHDLGTTDLVGYIYASSVPTGDNPQMFYYAQYNSAYNNGCSPGAAGGYVTKLNSTHVRISVLSASTTTGLSSSTTNQYNYIKVVLKKATPGIIVAGGSYGTICTGSTNGITSLWGLAGVLNGKVVCMNNSTLMTLTGGKLDANGNPSSGPFFCVSQLKP
ncbi:MAG: hypothetical protein WCK29_01770 [archaeon]